MMNRLPEINRGRGGGNNDQNTVDLKHVDLQQTTNWQNIPHRP